MSMSLADARYLFNRVLGLIHRSVASMRTRGWRATWQRIRVHTQAPPVALGTPLWLPDPAPFAAFAVPHSATPRVTLVIPVYNHIAHTLACLRALAAHPPQLDVEIVVVDDGSSDATERSCRRYRACTTTAAPAMAVSSPPATTASHWRVAISWCCSTTTPFRNPAGWIG